jgi:DNA-binding GntR family transcriptional regulator
MYTVEPVAESYDPVYDRLRHDLLTGRWAPGLKLAMPRLRACYGTGASPLREALNRLATEGLVVHSQQRGFNAAEVSQRELEDIMRTRATLEAAALREAFARRTREQEEGLVLAFHRLSRAPRSAAADSYEENPEWEALHRAFHFALLIPCDSPSLLAFCGQLYDRAYRYRQLAVSRSFQHRDTLVEHRTIFEAALEGNVELTLELLTAHYRHTGKLFRGF